MKVNDKRRETPSFDSTAGMDDVGPMDCRVVYVHPQGRFYTVEFKSPVTGETWRETFYFPNRPELIARSGWGPRLPGARE